MTGRSKSPTAIHANIAKDEVEAEGSVVNQIKVAVDRLVSRVIVTKSSTLTTSAALKGAFSEISYAIAQGTKKVFYINNRIRRVWLWIPSYYFHLY